MFIVNPPYVAENQPLLLAFQKKFGSIPPHFELMAFLNPERFELFVKEIEYLANHPRINPDLFAFLRLYIAAKENFTYCKHFNNALLQSKGYSKELIEQSSLNIHHLPFDHKHVLLAEQALVAVYDTDNFSEKNIQELMNLGWDYADIFDAVDHAAFLFKNSRVIKAFSK